MSFAGKVNLDFSQGADWIIGPIQLIDSTGVPVPISSAFGKLRHYIEDTVAAATFTCTVTDATNGIFEATLANSITSALSLTPSTAGQRDYTQFFYDLNVYLADTTTIVRVIEGIILVSPEASR